MSSPSRSATPRGSRSTQATTSIGCVGWFSTRASTAAMMQSNEEQARRQAQRQWHEKRDRHERQYKDLGDETYECLLCGAMTRQRFIHADWHDRQAQWFAEIGHKVMGGWPDDE